jgi:asparagine synthase (glutamine-hydrolysing)
MRGPERGHMISLDEYGVVLGVRRLAIHDTAVRGDQPFVIEKEDKIIYTICNGEIYNYKELKQKYYLDTLSGSDCEILPYLFDILGFEKMTEELIGEYALCVCVCDKKTKEVIIYASRDEFGVRPLYISGTDSELVFSSELKGSPFIHSQIDDFKIYQVPSATYIKVSNFDESLIEDAKYEKYWRIREISVLYDKIEEAKERIRKTFTASVKDRLDSDRPIGCLLSGGVDSSLVCAVASRICKEQGKTLHTFSIGLEEGSTDQYYAELVAKHIGSIHTHVTYPLNVWIDTALNIITEKIETWDTTTNRASVPAYLLAKYISENTDIKVILNGDGSDEMWGSYLYFHMAPSIEAFLDETIYLLDNIYKYDGQRVDRSIASCGLEPRTPFLDVRVANVCFEICPELKYTKDIEGKRRIEKWILREAFKEGDYLPEEVLYRKKEAFSDGVSQTKDNSKSWYQLIQDEIDKLITDEQFEEKIKKYKHCKPQTKEALYYRMQFAKHFGNKEQVDYVVPHYWLPKWVPDTKGEPSARVLEVYK